MELLFFTGFVYGGISQVVVKTKGMERSIHEMLKDAPVLNESDNAVHSGSPPPHVPNNNANNESPQKPATMNLSLTSTSPQSRECYKF